MDEVSERPNSQSLSEIGGTTNRSAMFVRVTGETLDEVSFRLDMEDMIAYYTHLAGTGPTSAGHNQYYKKAAYQWLTILLIPAAMLSAWLAIDEQYKPHTHSRLLLFVALGALIVFAIGLGKRIWKLEGQPNPDYSTFYRALAKAGGVAGEYGSQTIRLTPEGLVQIARSGGSERYWSGIKRVERSNRIILIRLHEAAAYPIPVRAFDGAALTRFLAVCEERIRANGNGADLAVIEHLRSHNPQCPKCKYHLGGLNASKCPECGLELNLGLLTM